MTRIYMDEDNPWASGYTCYAAFLRIIIYYRWSFYKQLKTWKHKSREINQMVSDEINLNKPFIVKTRSSLRESESSSSRWFQNWYQPVS